MNLKDKIVKLLAQQEHTYAELAGHLRLTEKELDHALETKTLEVRTLELISKELRIPLYSFFRDTEMMKSYATTLKEPYYNVNIWSEQEMKFKYDISLLKEELNNLKLELSKRDQLIEALENQLKKS